MRQSTKAAVWVIPYVATLLITLSVALLVLPLTYEEGKAYMMHSTLEHRYYFKKALGMKGAVTVSAERSDKFKYSITITDNKGQVIGITQSSVAITDPNGIDILYCPYYLKIHVPEDKHNKTTYVYLSSFTGILALLCIYWRTNKMNGG